MSSSSSSVQTIAEVAAKNLAAFDEAELKPRLACSRCGAVTCLDLPWLNVAICETCQVAIETQQQKQTTADLFHARRKASGLYPNYYTARYADFAACPDARYTDHQLRTARKIKEIADKSQQGCLLIGPTGTGKTYLLAACANNLLMKQAVLWLDAGRLERELARTTFQSGKEELEPFGIRVARDYDVVFVDEFTFAKANSYDWLTGSFQRFLNDLTSYGQVKLFMSSNNPLETATTDPVTKKPADFDNLPSLKSIFGQRGVSRLAQLMHVVPLFGPNRRLVKS